MDILSALSLCMACATRARQVAGRARADYCFLSFPFEMVFPKSSGLVLTVKLRGLLPLPLGEVYFLYISEEMH